MIAVLLRLLLGATTPTVGGCGLAPEIVGDDNVFSVKPGAGAEMCVVAFAGQQFERCDVVSSAPTGFVWHKSLVEIDFDFVGQPAPKALYVNCGASRTK